MNMTTADLFERKEQNETAHLAFLERAIAWRLANPNEPVPEHIRREGALILADAAALSEEHERELRAAIARLEAVELDPEEFDADELDALSRFATKSKATLARAADEVRQEGAERADLLRIALGPSAAS